MVQQKVDCFFSKMTEDIRRFRTLPNSTSEQVEYFTATKNLSHNSKILISSTLRPWQTTLHTGKVSVDFFKVSLFWIRTIFAQILVCFKKN